MSEPRVTITRLAEEHKAASRAVFRTLRRECSSPKQAVEVLLSVAGAFCLDTSDPEGHAELACEGLLAVVQEGLALRARELS